MLPGTIFLRHSSQWNKLQFRWMALLHAGDIISSTADKWLAVICCPIWFLPQHNAHFFRSPQYKLFSIRALLAVYLFPDLSPKGGLWGMSANIAHWLSQMKLRNKNIWYFHPEWFVYKVSLFFIWMLVKFTGCVILWNPTERLSLWLSWLLHISFFKPPYLLFTLK